MSTIGILFYLFPNVVVSSEMTELLRFMHVSVLPWFLLKHLLQS